MRAQKQKFQLEKKNLAEPRWQEKRYISMLSQKKKETLNEMWHLTVDLLIPDLLLLISAVRSISFYLTQEYSAVESRFSKSKVNVIQSSF